MQTIAINLLAEEQRLEQARARDPVKVVIALGVGALAIVACAGSVLSMYGGRKELAARELQAKVDALDGKQSKGDAASFQTLRTYAEDLVAMNRARTLCAPQLAILKDLVPDTIQITRVNFAIAMEVLEPPSVPVAEKAPANSKPRKPAAPRTIEHLTLHLDGKVVSRRPELEVGAFLQTLRNNPEFSAQLQQVQLRSVARAPVSASPGAAGSPAACFVVECQFKERS